MDELSCFYDILSWPNCQLKLEIALLAIQGYLC